MKLPIARIAEFISATGEFLPEEMAQAYSIDSRTVAAGQLFFAVKGERLDGHDFVEQALNKGAVAAVVRNDQLHRVGQAADCRDWIGRKNHHEGGDRACAEYAVSSAEVRGQLQQSFWIAAHAAQAGPRV